MTWLDDLPETERVRNPDAAPSGQGCALAFILMALAVMLAVFAWWWWTL